MSITSPAARPDRANGAVLSMALCVAVLIASEFMPVSLLTPIATDLAVTEGQAGQAISISGLFAVVTALGVSRLTRRLDRKLVQSGFVVLLIASGLIVALAPNYPALMVGRALLGVSVGGFWSMSTAIVMRLSTAATLPRGLAALQAGNAVAATISAPLGAWLGEIIGWRGAFLLVVPLAALALIWQRMAMPSLPPEARADAPAPLRLLARPAVAAGMAAVFLLFAGQFALFTYLRPYLTGAVGMSVEMLSLALLGLGLAGLAGAMLMGRVLGRYPGAPLAVIPAALALVALAMIFCRDSPAAVFALVLTWGFFGAAAPVGWGGWLARTLGPEAEAGGGLQVAVIQLAIMAGAACGGLVFDRAGWPVLFSLAAALLCLAAAAARAAGRSRAA